jgi:hypothetical protein
MKVSIPDCFIQFFILYLVKNSPSPGGESCFAMTSVRALSDSNRIWARSDLTAPPPGTYDIDKNSRENYLQNLLGVTKWKVKLLKAKVKEWKLSPLSEKSTKQLRDMETEIIFLAKRLKAIKDELAQISEAESAHASRFPHPSKPPFNSSSKKPHQEKIRIQEAPTFYVAEADWDFGSSSRLSSNPLVLGLTCMLLRAHSLDMSAWNYAKHVQEGVESEVLSDQKALMGQKW